MHAVKINRKVAKMFLQVHIFIFLPNKVLFHGFTPGSYPMHKDWVIIP